MWPGSKPWSPLPTLVGTGVSCHPIWTAAPLLPSQRARLDPSVKGSHFDFPTSIPTPTLFLPPRGPDMKHPAQGTCTEGVFGGSPGCPPTGRVSVWPQPSSSRAGLPTPSQRAGLGSITITFICLSSVVSGDVGTYTHPRGRGVKDRSAGLEIKRNYFL